MKTKIHLSAAELKNSEFSRFEITIRLDDECKNGHDDFSITGMGRYKDHTDKYDKWDIGGCVHDEILKLRPDLLPFVNLHLCNSKGQPLYTVENGFYFLTKETKEKTIKYLRITENEYYILKNSTDKLYFALMLQNLGIIDRWQIEANEAIKLLEQMTGEKYTDSTTKEQVIITEEQKAKVIKRMDSGYYTPEETEKRKKQQLEDKKQNLIKSVNEDCEKSVRKAKAELSVKLAILNAGYSIDNFIYYDHTNTGSFNWKSYEKRLTTDEYKNFLSIVDFASMPEGIKFECK